MGGVTRKGEMLMYSLILTAALVAGGQSTAWEGWGCSGCYGYGCWGGCYGGCYGNCYGNCYGGGWGWRGCWGSCSCGGTYGSYGTYCGGCPGCIGGWGRYSNGGCYGYNQCYGYGYGGYNYPYPGQVPPQAIPVPPQQIPQPPVPPQAFPQQVPPQAIPQQPVPPVPPQPVPPQSFYPGYGPGYGVPGYGAPGYGVPGYGAPGYGAPKGGYLYPTTGSTSNVYPLQPTVVRPAPVVENAARILVYLPEDARLVVNNEVLPPGTNQRLLVTPGLNPEVRNFYMMRIEVERDGRVVTDTRRVDVLPNQNVTVNFLSEAEFRTVQR